MTENTTQKERFDALMTHKEIVFRICLGYARNQWDAEDLTQEVYLKVWRKMETVRDSELLRPWLFRVARNTCLDHINKMRLRQWFRLEVQDEPHDERTPEVLVEDRQQLVLLKKNVNKLSGKLRDVFVLKEYGHLSYEEIAVSLGIKRGTVMSRLNRARNEVARRMRSENNG